MPFHGSVVAAESKQGAHRDCIGGASPTLPFCQDVGWRLRWKLRLVGDEMLRQQLREADHLGVHGVVLQTLLQDDAAVGAGGHQGVDAEFLELLLLAVEGLQPQRLRLRRSTSS